MSGANTAVTSQVVAVRPARLAISVPRPTAPLPDLRELLSFNSRFTAPSAPATTGYATHAKEAPPSQANSRRTVGNRGKQATTTGQPLQQREVSSHSSNRVAILSTTGPNPLSPTEASTHQASQDTAPIRKPTRPRKEGVVSIIQPAGNNFKKPFESVARKNSLKEGKLCQKCTTTDKHTREDREQEIKRRVAERKERHRLLAIVSSKKEKNPKKKKKKKKSKKEEKKESLTEQQEAILLASDSEKVPDIENEIHFSEAESDNLVEI